MRNFTAHRLRFVTEAQTLIELNEHQGSAIRGAFFHALRHKFCAFSHDRGAECADCVLAATCPVATLVSTLAPGHARGRDRPRPFTIQPPLQEGERENGEWRMENGEGRGEQGEGRRGKGEGVSAALHSPFSPSPSSPPPAPSGHFIERDDGRGFFHYEPGETLTFGLTLYAEALALFPYVVLATTAFEEGGIGRKCEQYDGRWRRGTLKVREVWAENPLTGERQPVIRQGSREVQVPDVPVTHAQIRRMANGEWRMANGEWRTVRKRRFTIHHSQIQHLPSGSSRPRA